MASRSLEFAADQGFPPEDRLQEAIVLLLLDVASRLTRHGEALTSRFGITVQQWLVLMHVAGDPNFPGARAQRSKAGILSSEIAAQRGVSRALVSAAVSDLLRLDLVVQTDDPGDRRRKHLRVTAKGEQLLGQMQPYREVLNDALVEGLSQDRLRALSESLMVMRERATEAEETLLRAGGSRQAAV